MDCQWDSRTDSARNVGPIFTNVQIVQSLFAQVSPHILMDLLHTLEY